jgi:hypothetical protein
MERYNWTLLRPLDPSTESDRLIAAALMAEHCVKERKLCGAKQQIQLLFTQLGSFKYEKAVDEEPSSLALLDELRLSQAWSQSGPFQMSSEDVGMILDAKTAPESRSSIPVSPPHDGKVARRIPPPDAASLCNNTRSNASGILQSAMARRSQIADLVGQGH